METFFMLLALCEGNSLVTSEFPSQRPVMWSFDVFFDLRLNKQLSKRSRCWWFQMPSRSLWHHFDVMILHEMLHLQWWNINKTFITVMSYASEGHVISNYLKLDCLFNSLNRLATKKTSKLSITGPFVRGIHPFTSGFPSQRASNVVVPMP